MGRPSTLRPAAELRSTASGSTRPETIFVSCIGRRPPEPEPSWFATTSCRANPASTVILDNDGEGYAADTFEEAVRITASLCMTACHAGVPVSLRTTRGELASAERPGRERAGLLDLLAATETCEPGSGRAWLATMAAHPPGLSLIFVTGRVGSGTLGAVRVLCRRSRAVTVVQVCDPTESAAIPGAAVIAVRSADGFESAWKKAAAR